MSARKKTLLVVLFIGIGLFGYSQYASASQIGVMITESDLIEKTDHNSSYNV